MEDTNLLFSLYQERGEKGVLEIYDLAKRKKLIYDSGMLEGGIV